MKKEKKKKAKPEKWFQISFVDCTLTIEVPAISRRSAIYKAKKHLIDDLMIDNYKKIEVD